MKASDCRGTAFFGLVERGALNSLFQIEHLPDVSASSSSSVSCIPHARK